MPGKQITLSKGQVVRVGDHVVVRVLQGRTKLEFEAPPEVKIVTADSEVDAGTPDLTDRKEAG